MRSCKTLSTTGCVQSQDFPAEHGYYNSLMATLHAEVVTALKERRNKKTERERESFLVRLSRQKNSAIADKPRDAFV